MDMGTYKVIYLVQMNFKFSADVKGHSGFGVWGCVVLGLGHID